jgi:PIN domain nuclease of toxin-antitoxin system
VPIVLDACAIIAFLQDENGADLVESASNGESCLAHAVNLCEVYKDCLSRGNSRKVADELLYDLASIGLETLTDMDEEFWKQAAVLKAEVRQVSYADCFALATARRVNGVLFTSDHHEFDQIAARGDYSIRFFR